MAAIGPHRAQQLIDAAEQVGLTPADLGRISGWGENYLEMMSGKDERICEQKIEERRSRPAGWSKYSRKRNDQVGGYLEDSFGLTSPATRRGECHFCGGPLNRRGACDECQ